MSTYPYSSMTFIFHFQEKIISEILIWRQDGEFRFKNTTIERSEINRKDTSDIYNLHSTTLLRILHEFLIRLKSNLIE